MFDLKAKVTVPAGNIWSVEILSSSLINTCPVKTVAIGSFLGIGFIFGPLRISTDDGSSAGGIMAKSSVRYFSGIVIYLVPSPKKSLGSTISPLSAVTAQTRGDVKYTPL